MTTLDNLPPEAPLAAPSAASPEAGVQWRQILVLAAVVVVLLGIVYLSPLRDYLSHFREISEAIRHCGWLAPLVAVGGIALLVAIGIPRLLFCVISGMTFGFWWGLLWAQLGTLLGNFAIFILCRRLGRSWAQRYLARHGRLPLQKQGIAGVLLARQLPVPNLLVNLTCGMLSLRQRDFLLGTLLGQLPQAIPCTLIGAGLLKESFAKSAGIISLAVILAVVGWFAARRYLRPS
jgi:uncharacterized membrane protein YdjX (TVP38/TMEM64 family)